MGNIEEVRPPEANASSDGEAELTPVPEASDDPPAVPRKPRAARKASPKPVKAPKAPKGPITIRDAPAKVRKALGKARKAVAKALKALGKAERALNKAQRALERSPGKLPPPGVGVPFGKTLMRTRKYDKAD